MKELRITCTHVRYLIQDLGLVLTQGQERIISEEMGARSKDLAQAKQAGAVTVEVIERCRELRPPAPVPIRGAVVARVPPAPASPPLDLAAVRDLVEAAVERQMLALRQQIVEELTEKLSPAPPQKGKVVKARGKRKVIED